MSDSLIHAKFMKFSLGNLVKVQVAIEFTGPPGKVIQESISKIINEKPRHTK
jgi:hypothetical protein